MIVYCMLLQLTLVAAYVWVYTPRLYWSRSGLLLLILELIPTKLSGGFLASEVMGFGLSCFFEWEGIVEAPSSHACMRRCEPCFKKHPSVIPMATGAAPGTRASSPLQG